LTTLGLKMCVSLNEALRVLRIDPLPAPMKPSKLPGFGLVELASENRPESVSEPPRR
jgi:hypothetical protein